MASSKQAKRQATITAFRLISPRWVDSALTGEGARKYGGRWNSAGTPVVYLSASRALAALETLVHLTTPETRSKPFVLLEIEFPADPVEQRLAADLPEAWRLSPPTPVTKNLGDEWLNANRSLALRVPSTVVVEEGNWLLNPRHLQADKVKVLSRERFSFDPRLIDR